MALILNDSTSNANNLTNHGATDVTTSLISGFTGDSDAAGLAKASSQYMRVTNASSSLSMASDLTIEAWVKFSSTPSSGGNNYTIFANWYTANHYLFILTNPSGTIELSALISNGTSNDRLNYTWTPTTNKWYYVAFTWKASTKALNIYQGDESTTPTSVASVTGTNVSSMTTDAQTPCIGTGDGSGGTTTSDFFDGVINEVRVWNIQRQTSDIQANYKQHLSGTQPAGLVAYYPFETVAFSSGSTGGFFNFM